MEWAPELAMASRDMCNDIGSKGHTGSDGSGADDRINRRGLLKGSEAVGKGYKHINPR